MSPSNSHPGGHGGGGAHTFSKQTRDLQSAGSSHGSPSPAPSAFGLHGFAHLLSSHKSMAHSSLVVQVALTPFFGDFSASLSCCDGGGGDWSACCAGGDGGGFFLRLGVGGPLLDSTAMKTEMTTSTMKN